ncbi:hypothetical protein MKY64_30400 [Paenibacillus sp. FSL R7-0210]|uniref:hypothetical protein n=1 Tax=Paenibacillus sp. FSL R7-0210 TaxID=2921676 RepID=UPI0030F837E2
MIIWIEKVHGENTNIEQAVKEALTRDYQLGIGDFEKDGDGFIFLFDDETAGYAKVHFIRNDKNVFGIKINTDYSWDCVEIYKTLQNCFVDDSEV